jgi:lipopolysaccharide exporter
MKDRTYWLKSGAYSFSQRIIVSFFGLGSYFLLTRYLSIDHFGIWALFMSITSLVEMARTAFIQNAFIKFYREPGIDSDALFISSLLLNLLSTILFTAVLLLLIPLLKSFWNAPEIGQLIIWYCAASPALSLLTQMNFLEQANQRFEGVFWSNVVRQGALFLGIALCYSNIPDLPLSFFATLYFSVTVLAALISLLLGRKYLPNKYWIRPMYLGKLASFGRYILGTSITTSMGKYFDQFLLGNVNLSSVALYNASVRINTLIEIPVLTIANISYPKLAVIDHSSSFKELAKLYEQTVAAAVALILPVITVVLLFPELILAITAGEKYIAGANTLRILASLIILLPFNIQFGNICEIINKPQINFRVNLITNLISVLLNLYFIKLYGATGAAYVFSFSLLTLFVIGQVYLKSKIKINHRNIFLYMINYYKSFIFYFLKLLKF